MGGITLRLLLDSGKTFNHSIHVLFLNILIFQTIWMVCAPCLGLALLVRTDSFGG